MEGRGILNDLDWQWLLEEHPMLKDIEMWMLPPYTQKDIEQWQNSEEKRRAQDERNYQNQ
jgi:hypothetical protein